MIRNVLLPKIWIGPLKNLELRAHRIVFLIEVENVRIEKKYIKNITGGKIPQIFQ